MSVNILQTGGLTLPDEEIRRYVLDALGRASPGKKHDLESWSGYDSLAPVLRYVETMPGEAYGYRPPRTVAPTGHAVTAHPGSTPKKGQKGQQFAHALAVPTDTKI